MLRHETDGAPDRRAAALAGLRAYQSAERPSGPPAVPIVARAGRAMLRDYGGAGRPVLFVPSLINAPDVLDLLPDISLMRWLATQGVRPLLLDWGIPSPDERDLAIAGHVETLLLPLLEEIGPDAALAGYCLGGTMALAAAAIRPPASLTLIASPWHFSGFPDAARHGLGELWTQSRPMADAMGHLPVEVLQTAFWRLDPRRTVEKFITFGSTARGPEATRLFVALEDWANGGAPLTPAAGRELAEDLFRDDRPGSGRWQVAGRHIDPAALACPWLDIVSTTDRIVPAASAVSTSGAGETLTLAQGHVGMIVGGRARESLWRPLAQWLARAHIR
ncbi:alpha/beta hydrolase [Sphingomonas abietis]|uniref:Alpha/beta hydrolase n=1 Tax=Sphingomonas abietis TaxID=3012344 RepID=A0ABY7NHP0_9SPHN|nr:alpha/beta hydrolase [Sphingomonas abietis]WBO21004.1 alpha/beta hydrolase [Sphingomonas abietis]